ncbi:hypothetical protein FGO68_gene12434 [Halteria grandinella]|uniref:Uncharacterized protein n=1 Tax=Halteria grandinella TaxID=5974 RepID=A0A8J8P1S8_HALGN|nr:hypothetical protein FGO68_gene12434 [Halteria grandinella]
MSKELEYRLPLNHIIADYEVKLQNVLDNPHATPQDKSLISSKWNLFTGLRYGMAVGALGEVYRLYKLKNAGLTKAREWYIVGRLVAVLFFGQYVNFNHLQYNTDYYVRRYGYRKQGEMFARDNNEGYTNEFGEKWDQMDDAEKGIRQDRFNEETK